MQLLVEAHNKSSKDKVEDLIERTNKISVQILLSLGKLRKKSRCAISQRIYLGRLFFLIERDAPRELQHHEVRRRVS